MKKAYNVLIIDDHQIIIDTYKNALNVVKENLDAVEFNIHEAKDCDSAYEKILNITKRQTLDLIFLDIQLPPSSDKRFISGETLGSNIREQYPKTKIIVCTSINNNLIQSNIIKTINPQGFLIKSDISFNDLVLCTKKILSNQIHYSQTILELLRKKVSSPIVLDGFDIKILAEMANGARMKELVMLIPLSKSGIEKRKKLLKTFFNIKSDSDRELVLCAKEKGFI
jgi:DNA-binding NarL/FixJ family response regulator